MNMASGKRRSRERPYSCVDLLSSGLYRRPWSRTRSVAVQNWSNSESRAGSEEHHRRLGIAPYPEDPIRLVYRFVTQAV